jgi:hypothetical protein
MRVSWASLGVRQMTEQANINSTDGPKCSRCQKPHQPDDRFCNYCGLELRNDAGAIEGYLANIMPGRVDAALKARLSEQKLVEVETAELLAERAMKWMKTIGYFVGIPLLAASVVLSFFGYKTYSDFEKASEKAAEFAKRIDEETAKFKPAQDKIAALDKSVEEATLKVQAQLAQIDASQKQLKDQVKSLEDRLAFTPSKSLSPEVQSAIQERLTDYIAYLEGIGFAGLEGKVKICLFNDDEAESCNKFARSGELPNAFYYDGTMFVDERLANMPSVILHEYTHHALTLSNKAASQALELQEALADYFAASHLNSPIIGEGYWKIVGLASPPDQSYMRSLDGVAKYGEKGDDHFIKSNVWSEAMWKCRAELGQAEMDELAAESWQGLKAKQWEVAVKDFGKALIEFEERTEPADKPSCLEREITARLLPH